VEKLDLLACRAILGVGPALVISGPKAYKVCLRHQTTFLGLKLCE